MNLKLISWASGKKTYITVGLGIAVGIAQGLGYHIPMWVDVVLGFAGVGFHRQATTTEAKAATEAVKTLVIDALSQVTVPELGTPSLSGQTPAEEQNETANLTKAQIAK